MRTAVAVLLTCVLIGGFVYLGIIRADEVAKLKLNEAGDFIAGGGSLLALLWLIFGYFQQGEELKQNTIALQGQQAELQRQAQETAHLARFAKAQADAMAALAKSTKDSLTHDRDLARATSKQADEIHKLTAELARIGRKIK